MSGSDRFGIRARWVALTLLLPVFCLAQNFVFGPNIRVNDDPAGTCEHLLRSPGQRMIAARGETVYVTWLDNRNAGHAYFARSMDGGQSFEPNVRVDSSRNLGIWSPSLAMDDCGGTHVCWPDYRTTADSVYVCYTKSTDGGRHFSVPVPASAFSANNLAACIAVSRNGQYVYVARDTGYPFSLAEVILSRSTDGGRTFLHQETKVSDDSIRSAANPVVAVFDDTIVLVAWDNDLSLGYGIGVHFARSTDGGATFGPSILLNDTAGGDSLNIYYPSVGTDSVGRVYVVYYNGQYPQFGLRLAVSEDTGRTFLHERAIRFGGWPTSLCVLPDGQLFVAFGAGGTSDIGFTYSPNRGDTFLPWVSPVHGGGSFLTYPTVAANRAGQAFIAWEDSRNGGYADVYFAAGTMSAISERAEIGKTAAEFRVLSNPSRAPVRIVGPPGRSSPLQMQVFDLTGRLVKELSSQPTAGDMGVTSWDGMDAAGRAVQSGIYFVRIRASDGVRALKVHYIAD